MLKLSKSCAVSMKRSADGGGSAADEAIDAYVRRRRLCESLLTNVDEGWVTATEVLEMLDTVPARQIMKTGILKRMFAEKGFGFVIADDGPKGDFFVHVNRNPALIGIDRGGAAVIFDLEWDAKKGKYIGINCEVTG